VSVLPEILESIRSHLGVSNRVHDIFVANIVLERSGVVPVVSELVARGVPEHVRVNRKGQLCGLSSPRECFQESCGRGGTTAFRDENVSGFHILPA
jgi:hypothetical protein